MVGIAPLSRSLPDTSVVEIYVFVSMDVEVGVDFLTESVTIDSDGTESDSGVIRQMLSSSLTTSDIAGRLSVSSWQHLRANATNFSMHSEG